MVIYFTLIILSVAGMGVLIGSKVREIKTGRPGFSTRASLSLDEPIHRKISEYKSWFAHVNKSNAEKLLKFAVYTLFHAFGTAGLFVSKHYSALMTKIKSRKSVKTGGVVSFFLKNVAESKDDKKDM